MNTLYGFFQINKKLKCSLALVIKTITTFILAFFALAFATPGRCAVVNPEINSKPYFDFILYENLFKDGQEVQVKFVWDIKGLDMTEQKRLTVRPFLSNGAVEIFNPDLDKYINMADFYSLAPYLNEIMKIRLFGVQGSSNPFLLSFYIYDNTTGKSYQTPAKKIWGFGYYDKYIGLLNENLLGEESSVSLGTPLDGGDSHLENEPYKGPIKLYFWYLAPAFFLYGLVKSPNGFG